MIRALALLTVFLVGCVEVERSGYLPPPAPPAYHQDACFEGPFGPDVTCCVGETPDKVCRIIACSFDWTMKVVHASAAVDPADHAFCADFGPSNCYPDGPYGPSPPQYSPPCL